MTDKEKKAAGKEKRRMEEEKRVLKAEMRNLTPEYKDRQKRIVYMPLSSSPVSSDLCTPFGACPDADTLEICGPLVGHQQCFLPAVEQRSQTLSFLSASLLALVVYVDTCSIVLS